MFKKKSTPTFDSAMGLFHKANAELKAAEEINNAKLKEAIDEVEKRTEEGKNLSRAKAFMENLLGIETIKA